jgi:uncharacterized protein (TIGR02001 family)
MMMMNKTFVTRSFIASTLLGSSLMSGAALAEFSANIGVTSNYLLRGTTASSESAAVFGGLDYAHESGLYAGMWQSSVNSGASGETDLYLGFSGEISGFGYDIGYITYIYPQDDVDSAEVYLKASFDMVSLAYYNDSENKNGYVSFGAEIGQFSVGYGKTMMDVSANDYSHIDLGFAFNDEFSVLLTKNDRDGKDGKKPRIAVTWSKSFSM